MSDELSPQALRALADRLEQEASTAAEEKMAARIQAALDSGQDALADKLVDRMLDRLGEKLEQRADALQAADEEDGDDGEEDDGEEEGEPADAEGEGDAGGHDDDILPGRWRSRKVFGAKLYSGRAEPETVRYVDERGKVQSRPGRVPGRPYPVEWEQVEEEAESDAA